MKGKYEDKMIEMRKEAICAMLLFFGLRTTKKRAIRR